MTSEEKIEIIKEVQKKYYPGRKVWRRADGKKHTVLSPYLNEYDELRIYTTQKRGSFLASSLETTPPLPDGHYMIQSDDYVSGLLLHKYRGKMYRVNPEGLVIQHYHPREWRWLFKRGPLYRIVPDGEGVKFEKVELPEEGE